MRNYEQVAPAAGAAGEADGGRWSHQVAVPPLLLVASHVEKWRGALRGVCA